MKNLLVCLALGIALIFSGCGANIAEKAMVKETIIVPHKHKAHKHHRHHRF